MDFKIYSLTISKPVDLSKSYIATRLEILSRPKAPQRLQRIIVLC